MELKYKIFLPLLICTIPSINTLENGLARTPPMGWLHWQRFRCLTNCTIFPKECISEQLFREQADKMVEDGYLKAGYEYIIIDDCWSELKRDEKNNLQANKERFPNGIKALANYIHSKGLKFGIYADYGTKTCGGYPGSKNFLEEDAKLFAEWGVDYLKLDGCYAEIEDYKDGYTKMGELLNKTGRPIVYSCSWPAYIEPKNINPDYEYLSKICNLWRNWDDIDDEWSNVTSILDWFSNNQNRIAQYSGPGHWNDPDMLLIGNFGLSTTQAKAQMIMWSILAAPLMMSVDLRNIEPQFREILLNENLIKINQDPLGVQGRKILTKTKIDFWTKPLQDTSNAIGLLSRRFDGYPYRVNFTLSELQIPEAYEYNITNVLEPESGPKIVTFKETLFARIPPSGAVMLLATPVKTT